jgi:hypothetical protein
VADAVKNFAKSTLSTGIDADDTSIVLATGGGAKFPAPATDGAFNAVIWDSTTYADPADDPNVKIVRVTARTSDTYTVTRAQEGTSAAAHNTSGKTYTIVLGPTAKTIDDLLGSLSVQTVSGTLDGSNTAFTVPNSFSGKSIIALNGMILVQDVHYTVSSTTISYLSAPPALSGVDHVLICLR